MKNPSRGKKIFFLFLATILIMVLIWKNDNPVAEYAKTGVRLLIYPNRNVLTLWCQRVSRCRFIMSNLPILQV